MKKILMKSICAVLAIVMLMTSAILLSSCEKDKKKIVVFTSSEDYIIEFMQKKVEEKFPDYEIVFEYKSTGDHAAVLKSAGKNAGCDISYDIEYAYAKQIAENGTFADLKDIVDFSKYTSDVVEGTYYAPSVRNGGSIIVNLDVINEKGLDIPESYEDLLDPQYKELISMPNPKASGTGYMFLLSLVNAWGEEAAFDYFDKLSENILSFTSSGSGPVNALIGKEVAIGLGMTFMASTKITDGENLKIMQFEEGSPYSLYGMGIISGKENDEAVVEVFKYLAGELTFEKSELYCPEKIYKDTDFKAENFPESIKYADMSNNSPERKDDILSKWTH